MKPLYTLVVGAAPTRRVDDAFYRRLMEGASRVVAVDGGAGLCLRCDRTPDIVIGDMDSIQTEVLERLESEGVPLRRFPKDKDITDLDLALAEVARTSLTQVVLTACLGARVEHTLATLGSMARHADLSPVAREPDQTCWVLASSGRDSIALPAPGTTFSVMALQARALVSLNGVRYPLTQYLMDPLSSLGISNVVTEEHATAQVDMGVLLVTVPVPLGFHESPSTPPDCDGNADEAV
ncbi:MAG: thiamine diphosphokinase [Coriobacteriia bacterium]|nr:thiamine diphosphokinase [Coriobacteriia bacterium]